MKNSRRIWSFAFAAYCVVMALLLFGREKTPADIPYAEQLRLRLNPVPFRTLRLQLRLLTDPARPWLIRHAAINLAGNIVLFLPLGIFLPKLVPGLCRLGRVLLAAACIIAAVEAAQVLTLLGRCDVDDLILNLIGTAIGYGLYTMAVRKSTL